MKLFVLWAVIFAVGFVTPNNVGMAFTLGSIFGICWKVWNDL